MAQEIAKIGAVEFENIKRQMHGPIVFRAAVENVEITDAILGEPRDLATECDGFDAQLQY